MQRANLHGRAQIVVGDTTSHGGKVISGSPSSTWGEAKVPIARKGDQVTCPLCAPHLFEISEGLEGCEDFGQPMALEGHKTTCGAILIAQPAPGLRMILRKLRLFYALILAALLNFQTAAPSAA